MRENNPRMVGLTMNPPEKLSRGRGEKPRVEAEQEVETNEAEPTASDAPSPPQTDV